ncbi:hypothetical protein Ancab_010692 [Ancistrocladus abbreviatus]
MTCWPRRSNRVQDDSQVEHNITPVAIPELKPKETQSSSNTLTDGHKVSKKSWILDPGGTTVQRWNMLFLTASVISLSVDSLFFLLPEVQPAEVCIQFGTAVKEVLLILRSVADFFHVIHILLGFQTAYVAPTSRVVGRGELVIDRRKIASRYLRFGFWNDLTAAFPLPQILLLGIFPNLKGSTSPNSKTNLLFVILIHMLHRFCMAYPLSLQLAKASGIVTEKAWVEAASNFIFYLLACIVSGNCWYLLAIQRQEACWTIACKEESSCVDKYFDCSSIGDPGRATWLLSTNVTNYCNPSNNLYNYGIFSYSIIPNISSGGFFNKFFYCLWWGIRNISSQGQNLATSINMTENIFSYLVGALGLILFAFFMGKMQTIVQSASHRLEEWRMKGTDLEQWMHHRQLPKELRQGALRYHKYRWVATQGVDEEAILRELPTNLRRQTKQYLCFNLVHKVPLFDQLDDRTLHAICERLRPALYTRGMYLVYEGDKVNEMLFIIRGHLYSYTTAGGRTGFFNSSTLGPHDFCGEELLTWALDIRHLDILPSSTRTVKAISDVEGFTLGADDLKFIALQFRRMHSRELRHKLRFYSQHWRTWAACFIQAAWHRHKKAKGSPSTEIQQFHSRMVYEDMNIFVPRPDAGIEVYATRLIADIRRSESNRLQTECVNSQADSNEVRNNEGDDRSDRHHP